MTIHIHIERLILDGLDVPPGQHMLLQHSVAAELTQLITAGQLSSELRAGGARRVLDGGTIHINSTRAPALGQQIAGAVYGGIGE